MEYRKYNDTFVIRMDKREEVIHCLTEFARKENVKLASVLAIGACDQVKIGCYDVKEKIYHVQTLEGTFEITNLTGNVTRKDSEVYLHLHITLADDRQQAFGGHLNACRISGTCEMFVSVLNGNVNRKPDSIGNTGLNIFDFEE